MKALAIDVPSSDILRAEAVCDSISRKVRSRLSANTRLVLSKHADTQQFPNNGHTV